MPAAHPGVAIEIETNHRGVDPDGQKFDAWFACTGLKGHGAALNHQSAGKVCEGRSPRPPTTVVPRRR